ncbi:alpha/beta hydrolase [Ornithinimicrobium sp. W1665]|uniref:alpha/beta hydrolase n=1 Tax=Ornithinimicrobium sp. W1665 TaxID=3416666 RepID=UPI003CF3BE98
MPARQPRRTGRAGIGLLILLTLLVVVLVALSSLQRSLIYVPDTSPVPAAAQVFARGQDVVLHTEDGLELAAWLVPADEGTDRDLTVLYAPGNGGNRAARAGLAQELSARGFTVLLLDYRGYAGNPGTPTEEGLAADTVAAARMLEAEGHPAERTIYLGESLGTGVVAALASRRPPAGLVLRSPFTELAAVGAHHYPWAPVRLLLRDRYPVVEHVRDSPVPVTVIRAARDSVVPSRLSHEVARAAGTLVEEVVLEEVDHNDPAMFGPPVADAVARLADALDR